MNIILQTENLRKQYGEAPNIVQALGGVNLQVHQGEFVAIVGTSGSGKSTLLNMMGGLDNPTSGSIQIKGREIAKMSADELTIFRRRNIGFIFQNYNLISNLNVYENVVLPIHLDGNAADKTFVMDILRLLHLEDKQTRLPSNLSGGQQQRVAIARALAAKPAIILADEPTGNLDSQTSQEVLQLMQMSTKQFHQTLVMITHSNEIAQLADRIVRIEDGRITNNQMNTQIGGGGFHVAK